MHCAAAGARQAFKGRNNMKKAQNAEELKLKSSFESLQSALAHDRFQDRLDLPLAFWTLPSDRRLPLVLLDHPLRSVIASGFEELAATPGIGTKKLHSLLLLLQRAAKDAPPSIPITVDFAPPILAPSTNGRFRPVDGKGRFDHTLVSESLWQQWRETAESRELEDEKLGRLAPSLLDLPTVIWETPLKTYMSQSLHQIRHLRTHGEKRVRVVLEVFFVIHEMLHQVGNHARLSVRLMPSFVPPLERWLDEMQARAFPPTREEIRENLVAPIIEQLELDVGADVIRLAKGRLGVEGLVLSVRQQSRDLGVTRARVYQLLEECDRVMSVRWPEGRRYFHELQSRLERESNDPGAIEFLSAVFELFFPRKYDRVETVLKHA